MSIGLKSLISKCLKAFEPGKLQEFCLSFLPCYDNKYRGLIRHGGTAEGKTRKGTPDLISTNHDGSQIAVQCSTEKDYWKKPSKILKIKSTKPCKDIFKCVDELKNLSEIVLCSSQEIPTNNPNATQEIIQFAKTITTAQITFITLPLLEIELDDNKDKYINVINSHLYEVYQFIGQKAEIANSELILKAYKKLPLRLEKIEKIVEGLTPEELVDKNLIDIVIQRGTQEYSRFQRKDLPCNQTVARSYDIHYFNNEVFGQVISLLGVPKIGKTNFIAQISNILRNQGTEILWFDPPINENESIDFYEDFTRYLLARIINTQIANEYSDKKIAQYELTELLSKQKTDGKYLVIIDDFHTIPDAVVKQLDSFISTINSSLSKNSIGFIFITNKSIKHKIKSIKKEYRSPNWNKDEISELLKVSNINIPKPEESYTKLLTEIGGGHPLIALALVKKNPTFSDLLFSQQEGYPELHDEKLTDQVKELLFDDLLSEPDLRQFTLRLSVLIYKHDSSVLDALVDKVEPPLHMPVKLIIEKLRYTVLEGDETTGYQVAFVFKNIAKTYVTENQRRDIFEKISTSLFTPKDHTFDALKVKQGIDYSLLSKNLEEAFIYASLLTNYLLEHVSDKKIIKHLLDSLYMIRVLKFPSDEKLGFKYSFLLAIMAFTYLKIQENLTAIEIFDMILSNKINTTEQSEQIIQDLDSAEYYKFIFLQLIINLAQLDKYKEASVIIDQAEPDYVFTDDSMLSLNPLQIINSILVRAELNDFPKHLFTRISKIENITKNKKDFALIMTTFQDLGVKLSKLDIETRKKEIVDLEKILKNQTWKFLVKLAEAQSEVELGNVENTNKNHTDISNDFIDIVGESNLVKSRLLAQKADSYLKADDYNNASKNYQQTIKLLKKDRSIDEFNYAICNYNLGLTTKNNKTAYKAFSQASEFFDKLGYENLKARSEGEIAVIHYQEKNYDKTVNVIEELVNQYYFESKAEYAPAATMGLSLLTRLNHDLGNIQLPEVDENYPKAQRGIFDKVAEFAKPNPSISSAYYIISEVYSAIDNKPKQKIALQLALGNISNSEWDCNAHFLSLERLIDLLIEENNFVDIKENLGRFLKTFEIMNLGSKDVKSVSVMLEKFDILLKDGVIKINAYHELIDCVYEALIENEIEMTPDILAEIYKRKAGLNGVTKQEDYDIDNLRKAWEYSLESKNFRILFDTGQILGFDLFIAAFTSIKQTAEIHFSIILANCNLKETKKLKEDNLHIIGSNLFKLWSGFLYRRSMGSDYPYIINLKYRAENMKQNNTSDNLHGAVMILSLLKLFNVIGDTHYHIAYDWSKKILKNKLDELPNEEREYLQDVIK